MANTTTRNRSYALGPQTVTRYTRETVERALSIHYGNTGKWLPDSKGGYTLNTRKGIIRLRTLREAALWVWAVANTKAEIEAAS